MALGVHAWLTGLQVLVVFDVIAGRLLHQLLQLPVRQILNFISQTAALLLGQHGLLKADVAPGDLGAGGARPRPSGPRGAAYINTPHHPTVWF